MRWTDTPDRGWYEPASWRDVAWGVVTAVLMIAGAAILLLGQEPIYRLALWLGGAR